MGKPPWDNTKQPWKQPSPLVLEYTLHYLRTKDKQEVDFALVYKDSVEKIIEVKHKNNSLSKPLIAFHRKYNLPAIQLVKELRLEKVIDGIEVMKVINFLRALKL